ncbi:sarcosine oxidase subunit gamma [Imbroritus primus]|uniref:Sarcosine oxidase subunit gamma n=1 Tax=Imbroritus primus TaxID=3058603 RepID=A0ACD3SKK9_9BURK|nr:sarcosine oxidase subunit gamma [Burkholderiaceae bacterium PBA]
MWSDHRFESPLVGVALSAEPAGAAAACTLGERPFLELTLVRGDGTSAAFRDAIRAATGAELPLAPNTVAASADYQVFWLGPDEWLLQSARPHVPDMERTLRAALAGQFAAVTDVSSGYTVLRLAGSKARAVLQKGCPLDLHPRVFRSGQCAQSHYFKADILLYPVADDAWELVVRRSFADYAARILTDAMAEYLA